jgi:hypothetical protein
MRVKTQPTIVELENIELHLRPMTEIETISRIVEEKMKSVVQTSSFSKALNAETEGDNEPFMTPAGVHSHANAFAYLPLGKLQEDENEGMGDEEGERIPESEAYVVHQ